MFLGIILSVAASILFGISVAMQKYGMASMKKFSLKKMAKNGKWVLSIAIGIAGIILYLASLNMADLSLVQPISSLTFVIPVISGILFFKEKLRGVQWALLALVIIGIILVSL